MAKGKIKTDADKCLKLSKQLKKIIETEYNPILAKKKELENSYQELAKMGALVEKRLSDTQAEINKLIK